MVVSTGEQLPSGESEAARLFVVECERQDIQTDELTAAQKDELEQVAQLSHDHGLTDLLAGVDHCATRILAGEREDAILEFLTMANYYFWGAYNIAAMCMYAEERGLRTSGLDLYQRGPWCRPFFSAENTRKLLNCRCFEEGS